MRRTFFLYFSTLIILQSSFVCYSEVGATRSVFDAFNLSEKKPSENSFEQKTTPSREAFSEKSATASTKEVIMPVVPVVDKKELSITEPTIQVKKNLQNEKQLPLPIKPKKGTLTEGEINVLLKQEQEKDQLVRFYFEDASLENLVRYIEELFSIKFFSDDDLNPAPQNAAILKGNKITFKTNKSLTRKQAWNLFLKFLDLAGLAVVETQTQGFYRITTVTNANKEVLPTFFNTSVDILPDNSLKIRYIFFIKNSPMQTIQQITAQLASPSAVVTTFPDLNALIVTDKSCNIRSLMKVVYEFDKEMPEAMSVLKLKKADAQDVAQLYADLTKTENPQGAARYLNQKAQPDSLYFPANVRIIVEPRTNALILLGQKKSLDKIEEFITKYIDVDVDLPYSPLYIYEVQYLNAANLVSILQQALSFGQGASAAAYGGVRNQNEYFGPITITAEPTGNRIIIKAAERDYKKLLAIIKELDVIQPEVAIEVLIVDVAIQDTKELGSQLHNKAPNDPITNVNYQTSGLPYSGGISGPQISNSGSLLGGLISLAGGGTTANGASYLTIGNAGLGVWAIFRALKAYSETSIIANPFLTTTNNYTASAQVGSTRQVQTGSIISTQGPTASYDQYPANLTVTITPQISLDGSIQMSVNVDLTAFSDNTNLANGNTSSKQVITSVSVKDKEIIVLGGLIKDTLTDSETKVPILGDLPLIGWLFKNRQKILIRSNILIFISPRILTPQAEESFLYYTLNKAEDAKETVIAMENTHASRDPIDRSFFKGATVEEINEFLLADSRVEKAEEVMRKKDKAIFKHERRQRKKKTPQELNESFSEPIKESVEAEKKKADQKPKKRRTRFRNNKNDDVFKKDTP